MIALTLLYFFSLLCSITFAHHSQGEHSRYVRALRTSPRAAVPLRCCLHFQVPCRGGKDEGFFEAQNLAEAGDDVRFEYGFAPTGGPVYDASTELHAPNVLR